MITYAQLPGTGQLAGGAQAAGALDAGDEEAVDVILVGAGEAAKVGLEIDGLARNGGGEETPDGGFAEADEAGVRRVQPGQGGEDVLHAVGIVGSC